MGTREVTLGGSRKLTNTTQQRERTKWESNEKGQTENKFIHVFLLLNRTCYMAASELLTAVHALSALGADMELQATMLQLVIMNHPEL